MCAVNTDDFMCCVSNRSVRSSLLEPVFRAALRSDLIQLSSGHLLTELSHFEHSHKLQTDLLYNPMLAKCHLSFDRKCAYERKD